MDAQAVPQRPVSAISATPITDIKDDGKPSEGVAVPGSRPSGRRSFLKCLFLLVLIVFIQACVLAGAPRLTSQGFLDALLSIFAWSVVALYK